MISLHPRSGKEVSVFTQNVRESLRIIFLCVLCRKQPGFPTTEAKFRVKRRMECGWVKAKESPKNP